MPYYIRKQNGKFQVVGPSGVHGTHPSKANAEEQVKALYANTGNEAAEKKVTQWRKKI